MSVILRILGLKKSNYYRWRSLESSNLKAQIKKEGIIPGFSYTFSGTKLNDLEIQKLITIVLSDEFGKHYGYKKVTSVLRRDNQIRISKKKVYRLMLTMGV